MAEFCLPSLGADMTAATLVAWKVKPGDVITRGQVVAEVETDKGVIDVECFEVGKVEKLVAEPGEKLPVGAVLAIIHGNSDTAPTPPPTPVSASISVPSSAPSSSTSTFQPETAQVRRKVTPAARKRAAELGIDPEILLGTGPDGIIELADVERASRDTPSTTVTADDSRDRMRHAIAAAMSKSKREIPHYYLSLQIDVSPALAWLEEANRQHSLAERMLPSVLFIKATALALRDVPELNGFWVEDRARPSTSVHIGFAIAMKGGGLVAPAIHDADHKSLAELMTTLNDLIPRARVGRLRSSEMTAATATLTNLGDLGVESVFGVIYPPQVALIGIGKAASRPWVVNDALCIRQVTSATLAADHRATDGRLGAQFLDALNARLQKPEQL